MTNSIGLYTVVIISSQDLVISFFKLSFLLFCFQVPVIVTEHSEIYIQNKKLAKTFKIFTSLYYSPFLWYRILIRLSIVMVHFHCFAQKIWFWHGGKMCVFAVALWEGGSGRLGVRGSPRQAAIGGLPLVGGLPFAMLAKSADLTFPGYPVDSK